MNICENCGKKYEPDRKVRKFCSRSCAATFNNSLKAKRGQGPNSIRWINCEFCGSRTKVKISSNFNYCSRNCSNRHLFQRWCNGEDVMSHLTWKNEFPAWAKVLLLEEAGYQCQAVRSDTGQRCTESRRKPNGNSILEVEHKDGDSSNHTRKNIELLCPSCHSLTATYRAGNYGKSSRTHRRVAARGNI